MTRISAFPSGSSSTSYRGEIDLRAELHRMYFGSSQETPKSHRTLLRRARRDSNNKLIACPCVDELTRESDVDHYCPVCGPRGEGYLWDEEFIDVRRMFIRPSNTSMALREQYEQPGMFNVAAIIYWFEYNVGITMDDRVVELAYGEDGEPLIPYVRQRLYKPDFIDPLRGDNGRIEFYAVYCLQKDSIAIGGL